MSIQRNGCPFSMNAFDCCVVDLSLFLGGEEGKGSAPYAGTGTAVSGRWPPS